MICSAVIDFGLAENKDGWPHGYSVTCQQTVGVTRVYDLNNREYGYCRYHKGIVLATVRRADAMIRATHDRWESTHAELREVRPEFGNREIVRL
jgi:hypothetical protein